MEVPRHPRTREDLILRQLDEEFCVYDPVSDDLLVLNRTAALIFDLADGTRSIEEITAELSRAFEGTETSGISDDVESTLEQFVEWGVFDEGGRSAET